MQLYDEENYTSAVVTELFRRWNVQAESDRSESLVQQYSTEVGNLFLHVAPGVAKEKCKN
jgi:hypothetical protein